MNGDRISGYGQNKRHTILKQRFILPAVFLIVLCVAANFAAYAAGTESADTGNEPGCGARGENAPDMIEEIFDPALYGEMNESFIYVSVNGSDEAGLGTPDAPYATVHKASSVAVRGQTIKVGAGEFDFTVQADIPAGVSLEGEGEDTVFTSSVLTRTDIGGGIALIRLWSEEDPKEYGDQHISYITFDGRKRAAWAIDVANRHNVSIHDCRIVDFREAGVGWHATDLSRQSIEDTNPDVLIVNGSFVTGGRFYNNYLRDNTRFDGWGRGSLFICGLEDFRIYNNTMIEDVRTSPEGSRGVPLKVWYYSGWLRDVKIHDNDIQRLGSATFSSDSNGWDFAIEIAAPYAGLEICGNHFIGSVDMNGGFTEMGDVDYEYSAWIHDNTFTADPEPKYDGGTAYFNEEYAITLERLTQKTIIEFNTVTCYDTVVYFNGRQEISSVTFRNNLCTHLGGRGGSMIRLDGRSGNGFSDRILVKDLTISGNILSSIRGDGASGFGIILGQEMSCAWEGENIEVSGNRIDGCIYPYWFAIAKAPEAIDGLIITGNVVHGDNGISVPAEGVKGFVYADNTVTGD